MDFHLEFPVSPFKNKIRYSDKLLFIGSCFAENIGEKMEKYKMNVTINPHGVLYNPKSIAVALKRYVENKEFSENELFYANEAWNSWEHHSRYSDPDKNTCINGINNEISNAHIRIKECNWLIITFGSAFSYSHKDSGLAVANCHKVSNKEFAKELLTVDSIKKDFQALISEMRKINPSLNIVFTVSPVRYIRDGVVENNLSKSILIQSVHELVKLYDNTFYFPAYELIIDDLRDYRFYKADLVHPNDLAIEYVFEKLMNASFDDDGKTIYEKVKEIITASEHVPFNENSEGYKKFKDHYHAKCRGLQNEFPFFNLSQEIEKFS